MEKTLRIKEAVILTSQGRNIPLSKVREGYIVNVSGTLTSKGKNNIFIRTQVLKENGKFFLKEGGRVKITPKTVVPA